MAALGIAVVSLAAATTLAWSLLAGSVPARSAPLDLSHYTLTFEDAFGTADIVGYGPFSSYKAGMRWIAHTPWNGDFGDATFANPSNAGPFFFTPDGLHIVATRDASGKWQSGLIASVDRDGAGQQGFSQKYGYFEIKAKLPNGPGVWPAFWLSGVDKTVAGSEIDVFEYYGKFPDTFHSVEHIWKGKDSWAVEHVTKVEPYSLTDRFNLFGVLITAERTVFYLNRQPVWDTPTPPEYRQPMYILANLALGAGWPLAGLEPPVTMQIAYVRVYRDTAAGGAGQP